MVRSSVAILFLLVSIGVSMDSSDGEVTSTTQDPYLEVTDPVIVCTGLGEVYDECGPACGDRTCENQGRSDIQCTKMCVQGCFCRRGYVRSNISGNCILPFRCARGA